MANKRAKPVEALRAHPPPPAKRIDEKPEPVKAAPVVEATHPEVVPARYADTPTDAQVLEAHAAVLAQRDGKSMLNSGLEVAASAIERLKG